MWFAVAYFQKCYILILKWASESICRYIGSMSVSTYYHIKISIPRDIVNQIRMQKIENGINVQLKIICESVISAEGII